MAKFKIQGPDGSNYVVNAPNEEEAIKGLRFMFGQREDGLPTPNVPKNAEWRNDPRDNLMGKVDATVRGIADFLSLGTADDIAAAGDAALQPVIGSGAPGVSFSERYGKNAEGQRLTDESDAADRKPYRLGGQLLGGLAGGYGLVRRGWSLGANAGARGEGLGRVGLYSAVDGGVLGAAQGAGSGDTLDDRLAKALAGIALGAPTGFAAPFATAALSTAAKPLRAPIMAARDPQKYADMQLARALMRSGGSPTDVEFSLQSALTDGQGGAFNVADALGHSGGRALSTVTRSPNDMRQHVVDLLDRRQAGQGRRVTDALSDAFDAPDTAAQRTASLTGARDTAADVNYAAARSAALPVHVSGALAKIDEVLAPGVMGVTSPSSSLADDSIESALRKFRGRLGNGQEIVTDFNAALRIKHDIDDAIGVAVRQGQDNRARLLTGVRNELDNALASASEPYAAARDTFRQQSKPISAVDAGRNAAQRGRPDDTVRNFMLMMPDEQAAFRAGYADPLIESTQTAPMGADKSRPLLTDATAQEFPAFAVEGRADPLMRILDREKQMFQTRTAAVGGSKTADNLADAADMGQIDSGVIANLIQGRPYQAAIAVISKAVAGASGQTPEVLNRIAKVLIETRPDVARRMLDDALRTPTRNNALRGVINAITANIAGGTGPRVLPPFGNRSPVLSAEQRP